MSTRQIIYAPHPIFKQKSEPITEITDDIRSLAQDLLDTIRDHNGIGIAAPMIGIKKRLIVIDHNEKVTDSVWTMVNPEITKKSESLQIHSEGSLCFPGIWSDISRPDRIEVSYSDLEGTPQNIVAEGFFATVIQHEIDYLDGIVFLDYLSKMKRDMLMRELQKNYKLH